MVNHRCRFYGCIAFGIFAALPAWGQTNVVQEVQGTIRKGSATFFHGFVAEMESIGSQGDGFKSDVQADGSFRFRNVPAGEYRIRVTNYQGETIVQQFTNISPQVPSVTLDMPEPVDARPPDGAVSIGRLLHPPAAKAVKAFTAAQKLSGSGKYQAAVSKLEDAVRISPDFSEAWTNLTVEHVLLRQYDQAASDARRAIEIAGPNSIDLCNLALAQWALHRYPEALDSALRGAQLDPSSAKAQYLAGALLADAKRWNEAIPRLRYAARTMPVARQILDHAPPVRQGFLPSNP